MKIYTEVTIDIVTGKILKEKSFDYSGPIAFCGGGSESSSEPLALDQNLNTLWSWAMDMWTRINEGYDPVELTDQYYGGITDIITQLNGLDPEVRGIVNEIAPQMDNSQTWLTNTINVMNSLWQETQYDFDDLNKALEEPIQYDRNIISAATDYYYGAQKDFENIKAQMPTVSFMGNTGSGSSNINMQAYPSNAALRWDQQFNTAAQTGQNAINSMQGLMGQQATNVGTSAGIRSGISSDTAGVIGQYQDVAKDRANLYLMPTNTALQTVPLQQSALGVQYGVPMDWYDFVKQIQQGRYNTPIQSSTDSGGFSFGVGIGPTGPSAGIGFG